MKLYLKLWNYYIFIAKKQRFPPTFRMMKSEPDNSWCVSTIEEFLYYCCPECDMKHPSREIFLQHAINHHPLSKECLHMLTGVKDEHFLNDDYMDDDHIMDSADPIKVYPNLFT